MHDGDTTDSGSSRNGRFATTHWSVILAAGKGQSADSRQALEALCQTYWFPLYAYLRRRGHDAQQAEDYTQGFFARLLERKGLERADPEQGKFRSFLLGSLKNFLADEWDRERAQKRGGGSRVLSLDVQDAETRYMIEPAHELSPERLFERSWALTVLQHAMARLKDEYADANKQPLFDHLKVCLSAGSARPSYHHVAARLGMSAGAVKVAAHRLKRRYRDLVRCEIAQTVHTVDQIDEEIQDLFGALSS